jgi:hypothetical protein
VRWGEEAKEGKTWGSATESLTRANSLGLGASGIGCGLLRHREDLVVRRSDRQEEGRREQGKPEFLVPRNQETTRPPENSEKRKEITRKVPEFSRKLGAPSPAMLRGR